MGVLPLQYMNSDTAVKLGLKQAKHGKDWPRQAKKLEKKGQIQVLMIGEK